MKSIAVCKMVDTTFIVVVVLLSMAILLALVHIYVGCHREPAYRRAEYDAGYAAGCAAPHDPANTTPPPYTA